MEILVVVLIIALIAAIAFAVMQRRPAGARLLGRGRVLPARHRGAARRSPMAAAVVRHAEASDPEEIRVEEQRMRSQANREAAGLHRSNAAAMGGAGVEIGNDQAHLQAEAHRQAAAVHERAAENLAHGASYDDPRTDGYVDPAADPPADGYVDPAADPPADGYVDPAADPRYDDRIR